MKVSKLDEAFSQARIEQRQTLPAFGCCVTIPLDNDSNSLDLDVAKIPITIRTRSTDLTGTLTQNYRVGACDLVRVATLTSAILKQQAECLYGQLQEHYSAFGAA